MPIADVASQDFADVAARLCEAWDGSGPLHDRRAGIVRGERQRKPAVESVEQLSEIPASAAHRLSWVHGITHAERSRCPGCQLHQPVGAAGRVVSSRVEGGLLGDHGRHQRRRQPAARRFLPDDVCVGPCLPASDAGRLPIAGAAGSERDCDQRQRDNGAGLWRPQSWLRRFPSLPSDQQRWDDEIVDQSRAPDVAARVRQQGRHGSPFFMQEAPPAAATRPASVVGAGFTAWR